VETCGIDAEVKMSIPASGPVDYPEITADTTLGRGEQTHQRSIGYSDTRYQVISNGGQPLQSFTLASVSPVCDISLGGGYQFEAGMDYSATASPLKISLGGVTLDSSNNPNILIGQKLVATLSSGGLTPSNFVWSISGGVPVYYYDYALGKAPDAWTPSKETSASTTCYFTDPSSQPTIQCSAHLSVPSGCYPTTGLDVSVNSSQIGLHPPVFANSINIGSAIPWLDDPPTSGFCQLQHVSTLLDSAGNLQAADGIDWYDVTVLTPSQFTTNLYGDGSWSIFQIITPEFEYGNPVETYRIAGNPVINNTGLVLVGGQPCADGGEPYGNGTFPADGNPHGDEDSPGAGFSSSVRLGDGNPETYVNLNFNFVDYLMYQPPSSLTWSTSDTRSTIRVPLHDFTWYFKFNASANSSGDWTINNPDSDLSDGADYPGFPTWSYILPTDVPVLNYS